MKTKKSLPKLKLDNLRKLRDMGMNYAEIGRIYGTSRTKVFYWLRGRSGVHFAAQPRACDLCDRVGYLIHHNWGDVRIGMWLCTRCDNAAEVLDRLPMFHQEYADLRKAVEASIA